MAVIRYITHGARGKWRATLTQRRNARQAVRRPVSAPVSTRLLARIIGLGKSSRNILPGMHESPAMTPTPTGAGLGPALTDYLQRWPEEADVVALFRHLLAGDDDPFVRARLAGHFTASCWLVDRSGTRALLTHHRKLGRWLQLGGHADGDRDLAQVALREAEEESGLTGLRVERGLFDLDRHWIPGRGEVLGHWHYDARYVVHADEDERYVVSEESLDLAWRDIAAIAGAEGAACTPEIAFDPALRRMARKWLQRGSSESASC